MKAGRVAKGCVKWGGPVAALTLAVLWWISGTRWICYVGPGDWEVWSVAGRVGVSYAPDMIADIRMIGGDLEFMRLQTVKVPWNMEWWFRLIWWRDVKLCAVPLWFVCLIVVAVRVAAWRGEILARRRALVGYCRGCGYDRRGLGLGVGCPE
ncbi:MAG: hypothetical protein JSR77_08985 [Planctomycetes bacterium]|nr:hypothetical protein [Planctomycetota bacterium]